MQHIVCACNFAHVDQVLFFFRTVYPKVKESGTLSKAVVFCSQSLSAQKIIAMVWSCLGAPVSYYSYDAMYTINGQFHVGFPLLLRGPGEAHRRWLCRRARPCPA